MKTKIKYQERNKQEKAMNRNPLAGVIYHWNCEWISTQKKNKYIKNYQQRNEKNKKNEKKNLVVQ